nr:MAG TPA: hypothetical protein [Caudoviricetes sp.]
MRSLREAYGYSMIPHPVRNPELSTYKGIKRRVKHRTRWMYVVNERHEKTKRLVHWRLS